MTTQEDRYIRALKFAESKEQFTLPELANAIGLTELEIKQFATQIHHREIFFHDHTSFLGYYEQNEKAGNGIKLHLSVEDKFRLLDYKALTEARESARSAGRWAIAAITLSVASTAISAVLSIVQINSKVDLPDNFWAAVETAKSQRERTEASLQRIEASLQKIGSDAKSNERPAKQQQVR